MDEVKIRPQINGWMPMLSAEIAYRVKYSYTGGHGSGGSQWADIPIIPRNPGETDHELSFRYFRSALAIIGEEAKKRETEWQNKDFAFEFLPWMKRFKGTYGEITLR